MATAKDLENEIDLDEVVEYVEVGRPDKRWPKPICKGWMNKFTVTLGKKCWRKRFFILDESGRLYYFKGEKKKEPCKEHVDVKGLKFWKTFAKRYSIEIERKNKPFIFYGSGVDVMTLWIKKLSLAGGEFISNLETLIDAPEITNISVKKWTNDHVLDFLDLTPISARETFSIHSGPFQGNMGGKQLIKLTERNLRDMGITKKIHRRMLFRAIKSVGRKGRFNHDFNVVLKKIMEMVEKGRSGSSDDAIFRIGQKRQLAYNLSDPKFIRKSYLTIKSLEEVIQKRDSFFEEKLEEGEEEEGEEEEEEGEGQVLDFSIDLKQGKKRGQKQKHKYSSKPVEKDIKSFGRTQLQEEVHLDRKGQFTVKLIITEISKRELYKKTRKLLSPVISSFGKLRQEFGLFHSALLIGPWYLEWNNSSLIIPRRAYSKSALIASDLDVDMVTEGKSLEEIVKSLSEIVCRWNNKKFYVNSNPKNKPHLGNCQEFVEDVMSSLGFTIDLYDGCFGHFLKNLRLKGTCVMEFSPSEDYKKCTGWDSDKKYITFNSHENLDKYYLKVEKKILKKKGLNLSTAFKSENRLLKSFDRAFWLRFYKEANNWKYKPLMDCGEVKCPFRDQRLTFSMV